MGKGDRSRARGKSCRGKAPTAAVLPHVSWMTATVQNTGEVGDADTCECGSAQPSPALVGTIHLRAARCKHPENVYLP